MSDQPDILEGANPFESMSPRDLTVLRLIIRQEVAAGVNAALETTRGDLENRLDALEATTCGLPGSETNSLINRVQVLETKATLAQWLSGIALGAAASAIIGLLVSILTHQIRF